MEVFLGIIIIIPFLYLNYKLIKSDLNKKIIPNIYLIRLLLLLPFALIYLYYYGYFIDTVFIEVLFQTGLTFIISFLLFHFSIWGAGDAKYLLVLALFIPYIGIILFILCIAFNTLLYLFIYFFWFWFGPNIWIRERRRKLYNDIWKIKKDAFSVKHSHKTMLQKIFGVVSGLSGFIIIFICLRFLKLDFFIYLQEKYNISFYSILEKEYNIYLLLIILIISSGMFLILLKAIFWIRKYIYGISPLLYIGVINITGLMFLGYEYTQLRESFFQTLFLICTLYLLIYLIVKMGFYAYKLVFIVNEERLINIFELKEGMYIDKNFLIENFQGKEKVVTKKDILSLENPLKKNDVEVLIQIYQKVNTYVRNLNKQEKIDELVYAKIKNTSAYSLYIFGGFILSILIHFR